MPGSVNPENTPGQPRSLQEIRESIQKQTEGDRPLISQRMLREAVGSVAQLVEGDASTLTLEDIQDRLNRLGAIENQVDAIAYLSAVPDSMVVELNLQRPEVKKIISSVRESLKQILNAKQNETAQNVKQEEEKKSKPLSEKIETEENLPGTITELLQAFKNLTNEAQQAIKDLPEKSYFVGAPGLDRKIRAELTNKDTLISTLQGARKDQRSTVPVEQVVEYDNETQNIGFAFNKRKEVEEAEQELKRLFQKWSESLQYHSIIESFKKAVESLDINSATTDDLTDALIALQNAEQNVPLDAGFQNLPDSYSVVLKSTYLDEISAKKEEVMKAWLLKTEGVEFSVAGGKKFTLRESLDEFPEGKDYSTAGQADLDDLDERIGVLEKVDTVLITPPHTPWEEIQKKTWQEKIEELGRSRKKIEKVLETKRAKEAKVKNFEELLDIEEKKPPKNMQAQDDEVRQLLQNLRAKMEELKETLPETEYVDVEVKFSTFMFRYIKRVIMNQIRSDINNGSSHTSYVGKEYGILFENKLKDLEPEIDRTKKINPELAEDMDKELRRFKKVFNALRLSFYAGSTLEPQIVGSKDSKAGAQRQIPQQGTDWFPSQADLALSFSGGMEDVGNSKLRFDGEKPYNKEAPTRAYSIPDFDHPGKYIENPAYAANERGDCKRVLDMIARDTLHLRLKSKIPRPVENATEEEKETYKKQIETADACKEFFRSVHIEEYNLRKLPELLVFAVKILYGEEISTDFAREVWFDYILFLHFSFMAQSSPSNDDQIYKAGQPIKYIAEGKLAGTTSASAIHTGCLVGAYNSAYENQGGVAYFLDRYIVDKASLSIGKGYVEKFGMSLSGVTTEVAGKSKNREKVEHALKEEGLYEEYGFLAELPFIVSHPTVWKTVPFVPSPLGFMVFEKPEEDGGKLYSLDENGQPTRKEEKRIMRWGDVSEAEAIAGYVPRPVTGNDYVTPIDYLDEEGNSQVDYDILYEMIPLEKAIESTELNKWYNNGKNIESLRKILYDPSSDKVFDPDEVAKLQNDAKYIAALLPDDVGTNVSAGRYDAKKVFQRMTIVSVFARCLDLLTGTDLTLAKAEEKMIRLMNVLGEGIKDHKAIDAVVVSLKQVIGQEEEAQRYASNLLTQVTKRLEFK